MHRFSIRTLTRRFNRKERSHEISRPFKSEQDSWSKLRRMWTVEDKNDIPKLGVFRNRTPAALER